MHGGNSGHAVGASNKSFRNGRHSKYLPAKLAELYEQAISNPDLLEMGEHIGLLEAHMQEVLAQSASGDPVPQWSEIAEQFALVETAALGGDQDSLISALEQMHKLLDAGQKWDRTWDKVVGIMEQLRKMTDTEVKRKKELNLMVPIERIMILMAAVGAAVKRNVKDPAEIQAVHRELAMLIVSDKAPETGAPRIGPGDGIVDVTPIKRRKQE